VADGSTLSDKERARPKQQSEESVIQQQVCSKMPSVGEMVIYCGHKGFVKLAIEQQAALVPVLAIGEVLQLRNLIHMPVLQKWTYKRLGFPVPWFMGELAKCDGGASL
jgi:hypothetical protein